MRTLEASSFRDHSGFVFRDEGVLFRQVSEPYRPHWQALHETGLAKDLQSEGLLIDHEEVDFDRAEHPAAISLIRPVPVPFISYPYEWCFSELKDAALCTLAIQKRALAKGMILKDASAYNIQFQKGGPVLIDSLSFEVYEAGQPWRAYRQFCRHFLAPLALMAKVFPEMGLLMRPFLDGVPLGLAANALPFRSRFSPGLAIHLFLHAKAEEKSGDASSKGESRVSNAGLLGLIDSLESTVRGLNWQPKGTIWADYYQDTNYSDSAMAEKERLVASMLDSISPSPKCVWDLGANTGVFSAIAAKRADHVVAWDVDAGAVEKHYLATRENSVDNVLPLIQDLTNPSPSLGWANEERSSILDRANADVVLALALIHHLAVGNNVPIPRIASFLADLAPRLIIEFVPKSDSQTQRLLKAKVDVFPNYSEEAFQVDFARRFRILRKERISGTERTLFLMERATER